MLTRMRERTKRERRSGRIDSAPGRESRDGLERQGNALASLPRNRPQRRSTRRAAPRERAHGERDGNVLSGLPRSRPQQTSPGREAARARRAALEGPTSPKPAGAAAHSKRPSSAGAGGADQPRHATRVGSTPGKRAVAGGKPTAGSRAAAKPGGSGKRGAGTKTGRGGKAGGAGKRASKTGRAGRRAVPRQGYAGDPEGLHGSVEPPGGAELLASAGELAGELAKAGLSSGTRALRDLFRRLPG
jgi:translation initiation factor IF-2